MAGYEFPSRVQVPTLSPCAAVLLEFGTEAQKQAHLPAILRGEELWMQFLSEPSGGSDVAGALTTAVRDGDEWVLNGSKVWTTGAWWSDWGLCLARTNWDVPKHRGLTVFILPIHQPGIEVHRIEMLNGTKEFCQEFITDVRVPDSDRVGEVDDGWTVGIRWMFHERMFRSSPYVTLPDGRHPRRQQGLQPDPGGRPRRRQARRPAAPGTLLGEARTLDLVEEALDRRLGACMADRHPHRPGARPSVVSSTACRRSAGARIAFEIAGAAGAAWDDDDGDGRRDRQRLPDAPDRHASAAAPPRWPAT